MTVERPSSDICLMPIIAAHRSTPEAIFFKLRAWSWHTGQSKLQSIVQGHTFAGSEVGVQCRSSSSPVHMLVLGCLSANSALVVAGLAAAKSVGLLQLFGPATQLQDIWP